MVGKSIEIEMDHTRGRLYIWKSTAACRLEGSW